MQFTNNQLTDDQLAKVITSAEAVISALADANGDITPKVSSLLDTFNDDVAPLEVVLTMARELLEHRKASAEPVADIVSGGPGGAGRMPHAELRTYDVQPGPLYAAAQPSHSQGIEDAAKWVDQQREAYDDEHGRTDPDTNTLEFGNDAQREYSDTLAEIAEGIRSLAGQNNE